MRSLLFPRSSAAFDTFKAWAVRRLPNRFQPARKDGFLVQEFQRAVELSFRLAKSSGRPVALAPSPAPGRISLRLPRGIAWGKPEGVPLPPGALDPRWAHAPKLLMVSPWHTATEGMWFLRYQGLPYCLRLTARGGVHILRFEKRLREWQEA